MFENVDTNKELSTRLRQDMNPGSYGEIKQPPLPAPSPSQPEYNFSPPPLQNKQTEEAIIEPQVETAPFIAPAQAGSKIYLAWASIVLIVPTSFFWLCSLLYVAGAKAILVKIVTSVPFIAIVLVNVILPIVTVVLSLIMLWRTEPAESGRVIAKISLVLSVLCLLALGWWLLAEVF